MLGLYGWEPFCTASGRSTLEKVSHAFSTFSFRQVIASRNLPGPASPFTRLYRQCTCHCPPPTDSRALESWTFTCSGSTRGIDRGSAKVSKQASSALHRSTRSRGIRDPAILFCDCLRIRYSHNLQVIRARKLSDTNNCHSRCSISAHRQDTIYVWDKAGRFLCPPAGNRAANSPPKSKNCVKNQRGPCI